MFDLNGNFPLGFICVAPRNFLAAGERDEAEKREKKLTESRIGDVNY